MLTWKDVVSCSDLAPTFWRGAKTEEREGRENSSTAPYKGLLWSATPASHHFPSSSSAFGCRTGPPGTAGEPVRAAPRRGVRASTISSRRLSVWRAAGGVDSVSRADQSHLQDVCPAPNFSCKSDRTGKKNCHKMKRKL